MRTDTIRIAYSWKQVNQVQLLHYGSRQWETGVDEDGALEAACTPSEMLRIMPEKEDEQ